MKGELYLGNRQDILKGGETGPAVDLENPMDSLMIQAMLYQDMEMPPKGKLPQSQIDIIIKWITNDMPIPPDRETERPVAPKSHYKTEINNFRNEIFSLLDPKHIFQGFTRSGTRLSHGTRTVRTS